MGMHIFNAYLYKDKADFNDIDKCIQDLVKIKKQYIPWIVKNIINGKLFINVERLKEEYFNTSKESDGFLNLLMTLKKTAPQWRLGIHLILALT